MEFRVGSLEEQEYLQSLVQKQIQRNQNEQINRNQYNNDSNEYKYLQYLVFKYCLIPNAAL